jgi:amidophosphoribosyltransferase
MIILKPSLSKHDKLSVMGWYRESLHEKCAVVGVATRETGTDAARIAYQALFALQHRGVEGSGIVTNGDGLSLKVIRRPGMVRDVFGQEDLETLTGNVSLGHNRYSTNGNKLSHLQPVINTSINAAFAHNGNLPDPQGLIAYLKTRHYATEQFNDSELFAHTIFSKLHGGRSIVQAVTESTALTEGAYSCVLSYDGALAAFRDPHGIRPLEIGEIDNGYIFASETCALDTVGATHIRSVLPGELVLVKNGKLTSHQLSKPTPKLDIFELVYFARHDSYMYGERVNEVRRRFGYELAKMHPLKTKAVNTVVIPIPDTSVPASEGYAEKTGLRHEQAVVKNRYVGRTFMQPSQSSRRSNLQLKHTMIKERISGRDVIFIDDSIVRGNTMPNLVKLAKLNGAKSVTILIASPPVRFPDFYGIDTPSQDELMASNMTIGRMCQKIGCDYLGFLSVSAMVKATGHKADEFNLAAFTGDYPVSIGRHAEQIREPVSTQYME